MKHEVPTPLAWTGGITDEQVRQIADEAQADSRSVWKVLGGGALRTKSVERRVTEAIAKHLTRRSA